MLSLIPVGNHETVRHFKNAVGNLWSIKTPKGLGIDLSGDIDEKLRTIRKLCSWSLLLTVKSVNKF